MIDSHIAQTFRSSERDELQQQFVTLNNSRLASSYKNVHFATAYFSPFEKNVTHAKENEQNVARFEWTGTSECSSRYPLQTMTIKTSIAKMLNERCKQIYIAFLHVYHLVLFFYLWQCWKQMGIKNGETRKTSTNYNEWKDTLKKETLSTRTTEWMKQSKENIKKRMCLRKCSMIKRKLQTNMFNGFGWVIYFYTIMCGMLFCMEFSTSACTNCKRPG